MKYLHSLLKYGFLPLILLFLFGLYSQPALAVFPSDEAVEQWAYSDVRAYEAWEFATGTEWVVVAVIDNGFDTHHPDLRQNAWRNEDEIPYNGIDDDNNGYVDDYWGWNFVNDDNIPRPDVSNLTEDQKVKGVFHHGTAVAGIIGAVGNNGKDGAGLNWRVKLMNLKALGNSGSGDLGKVKEAMEYAVDNGADIINISVVGFAGEPLKQAIKYAYDNGVAVIAAAGNEDVFFDNELRYPICADSEEEEQWVLGVSAVDSRHMIAPFSNYGDKCIDIAAPGVDIQSTLRYSPTNGLTETYGGKWSGTSFAVPFVSGATALIKSIRPQWGPKQIFNTLLNTVHHTPGQNEEVYAHLFGAGLLQIDSAVKLAIGENLSAHNIGKISLFNLIDGSLVALSGLSDFAKIQDKPDLTGIYDMTVFRNEDGKEGYVTIGRHNEVNAKVNIYDSDWQIVDSWLTKSDGRMNILVGDVDVEKGLEIIVAPKHSSEEVFRVLNFNGQTLAGANLGGSHRGSSLGLVDTENSLKNLLVMYRFQDLVKVEEYDYEYNMVNQINLPYLRYNGSIESGDIDGDGKQEIIVAAGEGDAPFVSYYERDGEQIKRFFAYGIDHMGGLELASFDYNQDGLDEIITVATHDSRSELKVWDGDGKKTDDISITAEVEKAVWQILLLK